MTRKTLKVSDLDNRHKVYQHQNMQKPKISVAMPVYSLRDGKTEKAIVSVLNQTFDNIELILVDDGSLDGTEALCKGFFDRDKRVKFIRYVRNCGLPALRVNQCIEYSSADYIAYMFEDDYVFSDAYENLYKYITRNQFDFVFGRALVVGGEKANLEQISKNDILATLGDKDLRHTDLLDANKIANSSVLHKRSLFDDTGIYDPSIIARRLSDWDLWLRISKENTLHFCDVETTVVSINDPNSLGRNVPLDYIETIEYMSTDRNRNLKIDNYHSFDIGNSSRVKDWLFKHPLILNKQKKFAIRHPYSCKPIVTKGHYDTTIDVTLNSFKAYLGRFSYLPDSMLSILGGDFDFILHRTLNPSITDFIECKQLKGSSFTYFIDDNLFRFSEGEYGHKFPYMRPGSDMYKALENQIALADTVVSYSKEITRHCKAYNDNVIERPTVIDTQYLKDVKFNGLSEANPVKICLMSSSFREKELEMIWPQLVSISSKYRNKIEFHFMGIALRQEYLEKLFSNFYVYDFTYSYEDYIKNLKEIKANIVISPLLDDHPTKNSKSPIKYLEATAAGAVFVASDVNAYRSIPSKCCIKVDRNNWFEKLDALLQEENETVEGMFISALDHVMKRYSSDSQIVSFSNLFLLSKIVRLLSSLSLKRNVSFVFHESLRGGATVYLIRLAQILHALNFEVSFIFPNNPNSSKETFDYLNNCGLSKIDMINYGPPIEPISVSNNEAIREFEKCFRQNDVGLVFCVTYVTDAIAAANNLEIPSIACLFATKSEEFDFDFAKPSMIMSDSNRYGNKWSQLTGRPFTRVCQVVKPEYFEINKKVVLLKNKTINIVSSGTIQSRKGQYEIIVACASLINKGYDIKLKLLGYNDLAPEYVNKCTKFISENGLLGKIELVGFVENPEHYHNEADIYICASTYESLPGALLQAMASSNFVITSAAGGIGEIIKNGFNGLLLNSVTAREIEKSILKVINLRLDELSIVLSNAKETAHLLSSKEYIESDLLYTIYETLKATKTRDFGPNTIEDSCAPRYSPVKLTHVVKSPSLVNISGLKPSCRLPCRSKVKPNISAFSKLSFFIATGGKDSIGTLCLKIMSGDVPVRTVYKDFDRGLDNSLVSFNFEELVVKDSPNLSIIVESLEGNKLAIYGGKKAFKILPTQPYLVFE